MRRAILLAGCGCPPDALELREYAVIPLPRPPLGRPFSAWRSLAAGLEVELSASWLILGEALPRWRMT